MPVSVSIARTYVDEFHDLTVPDPTCELDVLKIFTELPTLKSSVELKSPPSNVTTLTKPDANGADITSLLSVECANEIACPYLSNSVSLVALEFSVDDAVSSIVNVTESVID